jgi:hypothetical protein
MRTETLTVAIVSTIIGVAIGYFLFNTDGSAGEVQSCKEGEITIINWVPKNHIFENLNIDDTWKQYYRTSIQDDNSVGFSLNISHLKEIYTKAENSSSLGVTGVRIYPGIDESDSKLLIVKPLNRGRELSGLGFVIKQDLGDTGGPCPKWCDNSTRIIVPQ